MSGLAVELEGVWKRFRRGERHDSLRDLLSALGQRLLAPRPHRELQAEEFWALEDVSFSVRPGEALGVIGPNGAGKSTLLKLLYRILQPTRGHIRTTGRVGGLIEIAAGFHHDLTGRENIYLQGAIYGLRTREIAARFDSIVDFAGVHDFIDTPVKRYSSGMQARLGFAVAAHLDPDVLLIDEVLAVGDAAFQAKCVERMQAFKRQGTAILFVSHNMDAVAQLCDRVIFLRNAVRHEGPPLETIGRYLSSVWGDAQRSPGDNVVIGPATLRDAAGKPVDSARAGEPLVLEAEYEVRRPVNDVIFRVAVYWSANRFLAYSEDFSRAELGLDPLQPGQRIALRFHLTSNLIAGQYHLELVVKDGLTTEFLASLAPAALLRVDDSRHVAGIAHLQARAVASVAPTDGAPSREATFRAAP